jgi:hypothetical protein
MITEAGPMRSYHLPWRRRRCPLCRRQLEACDCTAEQLRGALHAALSEMTQRMGQYVLAMETANTLARSLKRREQGVAEPVVRLSRAG